MYAHSELLHVVYYELNVMHCPHHTTHSLTDRPLGDMFDLTFHFELLYSKADTNLFYFSMHVFVIKFDIDFRASHCQTLLHNIVSSTPRQGRETNTCHHMH